MRQITIKKEQYEELLGQGHLFFVNHNIWQISWLTYYYKEAVLEDVNTEECMLVKLVVK